jgi:hypothetical protein
LVLLVAVAFGVARFGVLAPLQYQPLCCEGASGGWKRLLLGFRQTGVPSSAKCPTRALGGYGRRAAAKFRWF